MTITAQTMNAKTVRSAYRNYLRVGYSVRLARKLAHLMVADARAGVYPLYAYQGATRPSCAPARAGADGHDSGAGDASTAAGVRGKGREGVACGRAEPQAEMKKPNV